MDTYLETVREPAPGQTGLLRSDEVHRWATEGSRAYTNIQREPLYVSYRPNPVLRRDSWFGSDGECSGYTPRGVDMVLADQKRATSRHGLVIGAIEHYGKRLENITVHYACTLLRDFGCGDDTFWWYGVRGTENCWTANKLLRKRILTNDPAKNQIADWRAKDISVISFVGGPPNRYGNYRGTLRTLVLDRVAVTMLLEGIDGLDKIT